MSIRNKVQWEAGVMAGQSWWAQHTEQKYAAIFYCCMIFLKSFEKKKETVEGLQLVVESILLYLFGATSGVQGIENLPSYLEQKKVGLPAEDERKELLQLWKEYILSFMAQKNFSEESEEEVTSHYKLLNAMISLRHYLFGKPSSPLETEKFPTGC